MTPRLLGFLRRRKSSRSATNGAASSNRTPHSPPGRESSSGQIPGTDDIHPLPPSFSSSSSYQTTPSSSSQMAMVCSTCKMRRRNAGSSFLNMLGCSHVICLRCFKKVRATVEHHDADEEGTAWPCPVTDCVEGFFLSDASNDTNDTIAVVLGEEEEEEEGDDGRNCSFYCSICMESRPLDEGFMDIKGCSHVFCSECIAQYVAAKVEDNAVPVGCPDTSCSDGVLEPEACRPILDPQVYLRWGAVLCEASIEGSTKVYCPYSDCSALLVNDGKVADIPCPHCRRMLCGKCKVPWHKGLTCKEFQEVGNGHGEAEDLMVMRMAKESRWRRCPKCGFFVERVSGCVLIKCRCKHCFCYRCGTAMKDKKHYCSKCHVTWDT